MLFRFAGCRVKGSKPISRLIWLYWNCIKIKPQIVHSHFGNIGWLDSHVIKFKPIKHVVSFYGLDVNMLPRKDYKWRKDMNHYLNPQT